MYTSLDASLKRGADGLARLNNVCGFGVAPDPNYEPAYKKQRRA